MKTEIKCEDSLEIKRLNKNKKEVTNIRIQVSNWLEDELVVQFYGRFGFFDNSIPVKEWAEAKNIVDRLIIKAEHLMKEDY